MESYEDLPYTSRVTPNLIVMGAEDIDKFNEIKNDATRTARLIGTHSDTFHCDEVLASAMLLYTKDYANSIIVRTRNEELLAQLDLIYDVGSSFDHSKGRYDHHQKTFLGTWLCEDGNTEGKTRAITKLSSAGLIYKYYGKEILTNILQEVWNTTYSDAHLELIYEKIYKSFILEIDA